MSEALVRLQGELLAVGLDVRVADAPTVGTQGPANPRAWLEELAAEPGVDAVVDIGGEAGQIVVEVWVPDQSPRRYLVSRVVLEPNLENASEKLAIRAIEVLRSSLLETRLTTPSRRAELDAKAPSLAKAPSVAPPLDVINEAARHPEHLGFEVGAAALTSLDGVGPAILPMLRFDWAPRPWLVVQSTLAGLGTRPTVVATAGDASVAQQYGLLGGGYRFRSEQRLGPFLALSGGFLHTSVVGESTAPKQGHAVDQWSFLLDGSLGTWLRLPGRYYLTAAAHVQVAEPYVAIHFLDDIVASSGRPNLLLTLTIGAWL